MANTLIQFDSVLGMTELTELYPKLLLALLDDQPIILECSRVTQVDTAAIQLLYAFSQEADIHGKQLQWQQVTDVFLQAVRLLGITNFLTQPGAEDVI